MLFLCVHHMMPESQKLVFPWKNQQHHQKCLMLHCLKHHHYLQENNSLKIHKEKIGITMQAVKINNMIHRTFISKLIITYSHVLSKSFWNRNWWICDDCNIDQKYYIKTVTCWQICKCWICNWIRHVIIEVPIFSELSFTLGSHLVQEKKHIKKIQNKHEK